MRLGQLKELYGLGKLCVSSERSSGRHGKVEIGLGAQNAQQLLARLKSGTRSSASQLGDQEAVQNFRIVSIKGQRPFEMRGCFARLSLLERLSAFVIKYLPSV